MTAPLAGVRVLSLGGVWAGRVAAMLLADQGAEVVEVVRPGRAARAEDALLLRGKRLLPVDFCSEHGRRQMRHLAQGADIVLDNLGPGAADQHDLAAHDLRTQNGALVHVAIPAFASGSPLGELRASEGTINASVGVYTDLHATGALLGGDPIYTAVPMASAYAGVHAAIAAMAAYHRRLQTGQGSSIEVPMADALMSAMALLAMEVDGQPQRFDLPAIDKPMTEVAFPILRDLAQHLTGEHRAAIRRYLQRFHKPLFAHHRCADGRIVFLNALDHVRQTRTCLEVLGLFDTLIAEGMVYASPYEDGGAGNNLASASTLDRHWSARLQQLMAARFATAPAREWAERLLAAGVPCALVQSTSEWLASKDARDSGCVGRVETDAGPRWQAGRFVTITGRDTTSPPLKASRSADGEAAWTTSAAARSEAALASGHARPLLGVRVLDLSNIIAGPVAARTLAEYGADVIRIDTPAPLAGPRLTMWFGLDVNQGKRALILDLKSAAGRDVFARLVRQAHVVIHNFLGGSVPRMGITQEELLAINPGILCCQVSAWAGPAGGKWKHAPAFDPVLQAATGITSRYGTPEAPVMHGVASCVDYISGFTAALGTLQALVAKRLGREVNRVETSLAMGAQLVQFPFVVDGPRSAQEVGGQQARGSAAWQAMYHCASGWIFLDCRAADADNVARAIGAPYASYQHVSEAIASQTLSQLRERLGGTAAIVTPIRRLEHLRDEVTVPAAGPDSDAVRGLSTPMRSVDHPSGHRTVLPLPSWCRSADFALRHLAPAPVPGQHTREVLLQAGLTPEEIDRLLQEGTARMRWPTHSHYLPL